MALWLLSLFVKLIIVSFSPLTWDENYYWVWSQNLQLSYYDHPAMVAWVFALGNFLPSFMLKWPAILIGHSSLLVWDKYLSNLGYSFSDRKVYFVLALFCPLIGLTSLVLTPDLPLLLFLALSVYCFERALRLGSYHWYLLFGLSMGLGFTAKYMIVLIIPGLLLYLAISGNWKKVKPIGVLLTLLFFILGTFPVWYWNYQHDWVSFRFQIQHGVGAKKYKSIWPVEFILSQLFILTPFFLNDFWKKTSSSKNQDNRKFFLAVASPILIFLFINSFKNKVEANWTQVAFPFLLAYIAQKDLSRKKLMAYVGFWLFFISLLLSHWTLNWWKNPPAERLSEPFRFKELIPLVKEYQPLYASSYQMASYLWYNTKRPVYKIRHISRNDFFDYFPEAKPTQDLFYVVKFKDTDFPEWITQENYRVNLVRAIDSELELLRVSK